MNLLSSSIFPQELFDGVIDEVGHNTEVNTRASQLGTLALVSRSFRSRAHSHLFREVRIIQHQENPGVYQLRELLEADHRLASYITSFSIFFSRFPNLIASPVAYILRALFNDGANSGPCSLLVSFGRFNVSGSNTAPEKELEFGLLEACHKRRLLCLTIMDHPWFPSNFLKYSFVKHLSLYRSDIGEPVSEDMFETAPGRTICGEVVQLESLLHHQNPDGEVLRLLDHTKSQSTPPRTVFSRLKKFDFSVVPSKKMVDGIEDFPVLARNSLEELTLDILRGEYASKPIPLDQLPALRELTLRTRRNVEMEGGFSAITSLLHLEQSAAMLITMRLTFTVFLRGSTNCKDLLREKLEQLQCSVADNFFASSHFGGLHLLFLTVLIQSNNYKKDEKEEYASIIRAQFPSIASRINMKFVVVARPWSILNLAEDY
ncbi:hypothetical protein CPC08DRAFT_821100 [Agrocybe pediades]|nr:hypothetical protein CPC08DRAFT_821100 [Agrocybe pediades]